MREMTDNEIIAIIEQAKKLIPTPTEVFNEALASVPEGILYNEESKGKEHSQHFSKE